MKKSLYIFVPFLVLLLFSAVQGFAASVELQSIRHAISTPGQEEVRLRLSAENKPQVTVIKGNTPKVVFDFPDTIQKKGVPNTVNTRGSIVKRIRVGIHTNKVRVVCDLSTLQGVERNISYDSASRTLVVQFSKPAATDTPAPEPAPKPAQAEPEQNPAAEAGSVESAPTTEESSSIETIKGKKRSAIVISPVQQVPSTTSDDASGKEADDTGELRIKTAASEQGSSASSLGGLSLIRPSKVNGSGPAGETDQQAVHTGESSEENASGEPEEASPTEAASTALLESVSFDGNSPKGEMVIFKLTGFYPPQVQAEEQNIPRIVCDFSDLRANEEILGKPIKPEKSRYVNEIRLQQQPDKVQAIVELEAGKIYELEQVFFKEENMFVLIVNEARR